MGIYEKKCRTTLLEYIYIAKVAFIQNVLHNQLSSYVFSFIMIISWLLMHLFAADIMWVRLAGGCDLTESSSVGMIQQAISKRRPGERSGRHPTVKVFLQYVLRLQHWQNPTNQTFKAKAGLLKELRYLLWWMFLFSQHSLWCNSRIAAKNQVDHPKKATSFGQSQHLHFPVAMCTPCGPSVWIND